MSALVKMTPAIRSKPSTNFTIHDDHEGGDKSSSSSREPSSVSIRSVYRRNWPLTLGRQQGAKHSITPSDGTIPLMSTKLGNVQPQAASHSASAIKVSNIYTTPSITLVSLLTNLEVEG